jgi:hypothetical protein
VPTSQQIPLNISIAPFPEGFQGDMDETFQQAVQLMEAFIEGNFLTGLILPPGSILPTSDQGPIAMGEQWYFWDPATGQYLPQTVSVKMAKNFAKNSAYQVQQAGSTFTIGSGVFNTFDMALCRATVANVLAISVDVGPPASGDNDPIPAAITYTVGPSLVPTPAATDLLTHEHLFEGADIATLQGQTLTLSFSVWVNQPGTYSVYLASSGRDASYVVQFSVSSANTWTRIKIPGIPPLPTTMGTWHFGEGVTGLYIGIPLCIGTQWQTATPNSWHPVFAAGTSTNSNLCTVANNQIKITGIKLEASSTVTYYSVPSFDADYNDLIRYYFTTFNYQSVTAGMAIMGVAYIASAAVFSTVFPRRMCKTPNVVPYGWTSHAAGNVTNISAPADSAVAALVGASPKGVSGGVTVTAATKGDSFLTFITADARLS